MAQVGGEGGKGKRDSNFELNLVPFIDLMSVMITFLLITAVWTQVSMIKLGSSLYSKENVPYVPKPPPPDIVFSLGVRAEGYRVTIGKQKILVPKVNNEYDRSTLLAKLQQIKQAYPDKKDAVIHVQEQLKYEYLIQGMDLLLRAGFPSVSVSTGGEE